jgi:hypothetical protein
MDRLKTAGFRSTWKPMADGFSLPRLAPHSTPLPDTQARIALAGELIALHFTYISPTPRAPVFPGNFVAEDYGCALLSTSHSRGRECTPREGQNTETGKFMPCSSTAIQSIIRLVLLRLNLC